MSNSTPRAALPPLPPGDTEVWSDHEQTGRPGKMRVLRRDYTAEQVEQIRRETVQACAEVAASVGRPVGASDGSTYIPGTSSDAARAILALLHVKEPK